MKNLPTPAQIKADAERSFKWWRKNIGNGRFDELAAEYQEKENEKGRNICFDEAYDELFALKMKEFTKTPEQLAGIWETNRYYKGIEEERKRQAACISW